MKTTDLPEAARACAQHLDPSRPVLAAVSGGLDSMCLLHFLRAQGYSVSCAHFNHRLRGADSDRDEQFVRAWCVERGIPFYSDFGDVRAYARAHGQSVEEAARTLRYDFLRRTARALSAQLVLAHHADDNAETVLLNLIRGTDLRGLCGMKTLQDGLVRPFLAQTRAELAAYASAHGVPHREDASNLDPDAAARNYLRLEILPRLRTLNPRAGEHIAAAARALAPLDDALAQESDALTAQAQRQDGALTLPLEAFRAASGGVQARTLLRMADLLGAGRRDISRVHLEAAAALIRQNGARSLSLPHGLRLSVSDGTLTLRRQTAAADEAVLMQGVPLRWGGYTLTLLDHADGEGVLLRALAPGETLRAAPCDPSAYLALPGASGARSIKRLCLDRRISLSERSALPALYIGSRTAAVWRIGTDEAFLPREGGGSCFVRITPTADIGATRGEIFRVES